MKNNKKSLELQTEPAFEPSQIAKMAPEDASFLIECLMNRLQEEFEQKQEEIYKHAGAFKGQDLTIPLGSKTIKIQGGTGEVGHISKKFIENEQKAAVGKFRLKEPYWRHRIFDDDYDNDGKPDSWIGSPTVKDAAKILANAIPGAGPVLSFLIDAGDALYSLAQGDWRTAVRIGFGMVTQALGGVFDKIASKVGGFVDKIVGKVAGNVLKGKLGDIAGYMAGQFTKATLNEAMGILGEAAANADRIYDVLAHGDKASKEAVEWFNNFRVGERLTNTWISTAISSGAGAVTGAILGGDYSNGKWNYTDRFGAQLKWAGQLEQARGLVEFAADSAYKYSTGQEVVINVLSLREALGIIGLGKVANKLNDVGLFEIHFKKGKDGKLETYGKVGMGGYRFNLTTIKAFYDTYRAVKFQLENISKGDEGWTVITAVNQLWKGGEESKDILAIKIAMDIFRGKKKVKFDIKEKGYYGRYEDGVIHLNQDLVYEMEGDEAKLLLATMTVAHEGLHSMGVKSEVAARLFGAMVGERILEAYGNRINLVTSEGEVAGADIAMAMVGGYEGFKEWVEATSGGQEGVDFLYKVKPGDSLSAIVARFGVKGRKEVVKYVDRIVAMNKIIKHRDKIKVDWVIELPNDLMWKNFWLAVKEDLAAREYLVEQKTGGFVQGVKEKAKTTWQKVINFLRGRPNFRSPVDGDVRITSRFGWRVHPVTGRRQFHNGIDIAVPVGTEIHAVLNGVVDRIDLNANDASGIAVRLRHEYAEDVFYSFYCHLNGVPEGLRVGRHVEAGEVIGYSGNTGRSTGPHLHLSIYSEEERSPVLDRAIGNNPGAVHYDWRRDVYYYDPETLLRLEEE